MVAPVAGFNPRAGARACAVLGELCTLRQRRLRGESWMCVQPITLKTGATVACRKCQRCRDNRVKDMCGRCIAEDEVSVASSSLTLTYGRDEKGDAAHFRSQYLVYEDLQNYFKRLRSDGFPLRFFAAGEYGSKRGRAHWHALIFWKERVPTFQPGEVLFGEKMTGGESYPLDGNFMERHWKHGFSYWRDFQYREVKYVCKYLLKDQGDADAQVHLAMSKRPLLGAEYFRQLAGRYVAQGVVPPSAEFSFLDVRKNGGKGEMIKFLLRRQSLDLFARSFLEQWYALRGTHPPASKDGWLEEWCDKQARVSLDGWKPEAALRPIERPWLPAPGGAEVLYDTGGKFYYAVVGGQKLFWSFSDEGKRRWRSVLITEAEGRRLKAASDQQKAREDSYRVASNG